MRRQAPAPLAAGPVPPAEQDHVQVEHRRGQRDEVEHARGRDHAGAEVAELRGDREVLDHPAEPRPEGRADQPEKTGIAQNRAPRMNATVTFDDSSDATRPMAIISDAHQPVAEVGRDHDPQVGRAQPVAGSATWVSEKTRATV